MEIKKLPKEDKRSLGTNKTSFARMIKGKMHAFQFCSLISVTTPRGCSQHLRERITSKSFSNSRGDNSV